MFVPPSDWDWIFWPEGKRSRFSEVRAIRRLPEGFGGLFTLIPSPDLSSLALLAQAMEVGATPVLLSDRWTQAETTSALGGAEIPGWEGLDEMSGSFERSPGAWARVFTSGTTGVPRAVELQAMQVRAHVEATRAHLGMGDDELWHLTLPLYHVGGLMIVYRSLLTRTSIYVDEKFSVDRTLSAIQAGVTRMSLVPTMLARILEDERLSDVLEGSRLRTVLVGGGPSSSELILRAVQAGLPVAPTWGMSEASSQITTLLPHEVSQRPGSVGRPLPGLQVRVRQDRLWVAGPTIFQGWVGQDEGEPFDEDGYFDTGDLGHIDPDGFVYVSARRSDRIVTGGENVDPREVELAMMRIDGVKDALVFGIDDPTWGRRVACAYVGPRPVSWLRDDLRAQLADFKVPRRWFVLDEIPRNALGKASRATLEAMALAGEILEVSE